MQLLHNQHKTTTYNSPEKINKTPLLATPNNLLKFDLARDHFYNAPSSSSNKTLFIPESNFTQKLNQNSKNRGNNSRKSKFLHNQFQNKRYTYVSGATLNVKTKLTDTKILDLAIYSKKHGEKFILLQETHLPEYFDKFINNSRFKNWRIINTGLKGKDKRAGCAILFSPQCTVESVEVVEKGRILSAKIMIDGQFLQITSCYTPDMASYANSTRENHWRKLNNWIKKTPGKYENIVGGDFNACIVPNNDVQKPGFGPHHPKCCYQRAYETNSNGFELLHTVAQRDMFVENTYFRNRKACHSWSHLNIGSYTRRYDYFLVDRLIHSNSVQCRAFPAPFYSDHRLVSLKIKLPRKWLGKTITKSKKSKKISCPRPNIKLLVENPEIKLAYQEMLEHLASNEDTPENINDLDRIIDKMILDATKKTVPLSSKVQSAVWMNDDYINLRTKTYSNKKTRTENINKLHKLQKTLLNEYYSKFAANINEAADNRDAEKLFRLSKEMIGGLKKAVTKSKCTESQHIDYITSVFKDRKLELPPELDLLAPFIPECVENAREIVDTVPTLEEVRQCMKFKFKVRKAPGSDGVFNENLKVATECPKFMEFIYSMVTEVWTLEDIPDTWRECMITLLYKKGKSDEAKNFRPLSLIHCVSKIITKIVRDRMTNRYKDIISGDQFGFRRNCGTIDAIYVFRQLVKAKKTPIFALFLDLRGAFDRLPRNIMFRILKIMLGNEKLAKIFEAIHTNTTAKLKNGTEIFDLKSGVRQGSDEGPNVFNIFFEYVLLCCTEAIKKQYPDYGIDFDFNIFSESDTNKRGHFTGKRFGVHKLLKILFADDLVYFAKSAEELQKIVDIIKPIFDRFGLIIAEDKTKVMAFNVPESEPEPKIKLETTPGQFEILGFVDIFRYLGHSVSSSSSSLFLNAQTEAAWSAFNSNSKVLTNRSVQI